MDTAITMGRQKAIKEEDSDDSIMTDKSIEDTEKAGSENSKDVSESLSS